MYQDVAEKTTFAPDCRHLCGVSLNSLKTIQEARVSEWRSFRCPVRARVSSSASLCHLLYFRRTQGFEHSSALERQQQELGIAPLQLSIIHTSCRAFPASQPPGATHSPERRPTWRSVSSAASRSSQQQGEDRRVDLEGETAAGDRRVIHLLHPQRQRVYQRNVAQSVRVLERFRRGRGKRERRTRPTSSSHDGGWQLRQSRQHERQPDHPPRPFVLSGLSSSNALHGSARRLQQPPFIRRGALAEQQQHQ